MDELKNFSAGQRITASSLNAIVKAILDLIKRVQALEDKVTRLVKYDPN